MNTPPLTPREPECPDAPKRDYSTINFESNFFTPVKRLFYDENKECPGAPIKKNYVTKLYISNGDEKVRIFFPNLSTVRSCKKSLFQEKASKIPRPVKTEIKNNTPKFAQSLRLKIKLSRRK